MKDYHTTEAATIAEAIRALAARPEALDNFEGYLTHHFPAWLEKWANTPDRMAAEFEHFANIYGGD